MDENGENEKCGTNGQSADDAALGGGRGLDLCDFGLFGYTQKQSGLPTNPVIPTFGESTPTGKH